MIATIQVSPVPLAVRFAEFIDASLTDAEMEKVREENRVNPNCCATHKFCDAGSVMADAWMDQFGVEMPTMPAKDREPISLMVKAWLIAKAAEFRAHDIRQAVDDFKAWSGGHMPWETTCDERTNWADGRHPIAVAIVKAMAMTT